MKRTLLMKRARLVERVRLMKCARPDWTRVLLCRRTHQAARVAVELTSLLFSRATALVWCERGRPTTAFQGVPGHELLRLHALESAPRGLVLLVGCSGVLLGLCDEIPDWEGCRQAVLDFRDAHGIESADEGLQVTWHDLRFDPARGEYTRGVWWTKQREVAYDPLDEGRPVFYGDGGMARLPLVAEHPTRKF